MNIIPLIFILVLVILIYLVYRRTSKESFIPDLSSLIRDQKNDTQKNYNTLMNDNICQSGLSITHILQGRTHFVLRNGRPLDKIHINDKIELPYHWTGVDLLAKHTNNKLFVIKDANVYFIDDFNTITKYLTCIQILNQRNIRELYNMEIKRFSITKTK